MTQKIQIRIPEPCNENWDRMTSTQQGRFCMSCQKEVIDFSTMSDKEILHYISSVSTNTCGRVADSQLNRDLIMPREPERIWWRHWMNIAASFLLLSSKSDAQIKKQKVNVVAVPPVSKGQTPEIVLAGAIAYVPAYKQKLQIRGRVVDDENNPVRYATVKVKNVAAGTATDSAGYFILNTNADYEEIQIQVSSVGYQSRTIDLSWSDEDGKRIDAGNIFLAMKKMDTVVVNANNFQVIRGYAGGLSVCRKVSRFERTKEKIKEVLAVNEIKVYPNPIVLNGMFNLRMNIKKTGAYALQFTDVSGKIIAARQLNISAANQVESFSADIFKTAGIYFVSVTNKQSMKTFTTKLLVQ